MRQRANVKTNKRKKVRRQKNRAESEALLVDAAKEVFAEYGFDRATTRMVAQRSGLNLALITRYFGNKQGLLFAVLESEAKRVYARSPSYPPQKTLLDECLCYAEANFKYYIEHSELLRIVIVQSLTDSVFAKKIRDRQFLKSETEYTQRIVSFFKDKKNHLKVAEEFIEKLERAIVSSLLIQYLVAREPKEKCLRELKELIKKCV